MYTVNLIPIKIEIVQTNQVKENSNSLFNHFASLLKKCFLAFKRTLAPMHFVSFFFRMDSKYFRYFVLLLGYFSCVNFTVTGTHQTYHNILRRINPFQRMCLCNRWTRRLQLDRMILELYPGLFNTQKSLRFMPVVKPVGEGSHVHGTGSYVGNTVGNLNGKPETQSCCGT